MFGKKKEIEPPRTFYTTQELWEYVSNEIEGYKEETEELKNKISTLADMLHTQAETIESLHQEIEEKNKILNETELSTRILQDVQELVRLANTKKHKKR